jgi:flagellar hook-length control protein FliK
VSIAPALPPPTSLPPPTGAAPPGAPPGATPFHSALEEELARTAPAEGQQTESHQKAREADAEAGNAPSRAHGRSGARHGRPPTVVPVLPGAAPTTPISVTDPSVAGQPPATLTSDAVGASAAPSHVPAPVLAALTASEAAPTAAGSAEEPADPAPVPVDAPHVATPLPTTGSALDSTTPKPESPDDETASLKSTVSASKSAPVQPSPETSPASGEQVTDGESAPQAPPPPASLGIEVSGRETRTTGLSSRDTATDEDDVRIQAAGSPESGSSREVIARAANAPTTAGTTTGSAHTAAPATAAPVPTTNVSTAPSEPLVAPPQPAVAQAVDSSSSSGAPLLASGVGMQEMIESIHATIELAARQGVSQARIALQPAELGEIRIHLTQTGDGLLARVTAETPAAAEALAGARSELHQSLGASLLRLDINSFAQPEGRQGQGAGDASGSRSSRSVATTGPEGSIDQLQATEGADATPATGPALGELVDVLA